MKKLLCVLMLGMVFGQAELTTRYYELPRIEFQEGDYYDCDGWGDGGNCHELDIEAITGYDFDFAALKIIHVSDHFVDDNLWITLKSVWNDGGNPPNSTSLAIKILTNGSIDYQYNNNGNQVSREMVYDKGQLNYIHFGSAGGWADLTISITAPFPDDDTGLQGDMNDDDALDVLDVVVMIEIILSGGMGDVGDLLNTVRG